MSTHTPITVARTSEPVLIAARGLTLGYGTNVLLQDVDLDIPHRGVLGIMGPAGAGKTTLLRSLAGFSNPSPAFWAHANIVRGSDVQERGCGFLAQKDRLYVGSVLENVLPQSHALAPAQARTAARAILEPVGLWAQFADVLHDSVSSLPLAAHKKLLIARMQSAACLLVDEPLSDVAIADEDALIDFLRELGQRCAVVVILHSKQQARHLCDTVCLVSGGRVVEVGSAAEFFSTPATACGREFLERGSSWLIESAPARMAPRIPSSHLPWSSAPILAEFRWVLEHRLGGAQRPGLLGTDGEDLRALRLLGVRHLVSLTEEPYNTGRLAMFDIEARHFPVIDMGVPVCEATARLCVDVARWIERDEPVVFHCRAGLGRTGTLLACVLVARGLDAGNAIQSVRRVNPRYIQTEAQLRFVAEFQRFLEHTLPLRAPDADAASETLQDTRRPSPSGEESKSHQPGDLTIWPA